MGGVTSFRISSIVRDLSIWFRIFPMTARIGGTTALLLTTLSWLSGAEPSGYYAGSVGLTGTALRAALHNIIDNHTSLSYSATENALKVTDEDPANLNNVILIYKRESKAKNTFGGGTNQWNREHVWPNSLGIDDQLPAYSDLFNLRPADVDVNADRANLPFDESTPGAFGYQMPAHPEALLCSQDSNSWEPPTAVKGDIARGIFYMDIRYEGDSGEPNLQLTDNLANVTTRNSNMGKLATLLVWHLIDPVDAAERARNESVYSRYQGNRNPFIDRPGWVEAIYGPVFELKISPSGTGLKLEWPDLVPSDLGIIRFSDNLLDWSLQTGTPTVNGLWKEQILPFTSPRRFY